ncbi:hypothetical protein [Marinobacter sp. F4216]|uniref:hypothetical protein n=1 Tax=Marinobacter sp. F4216 TaxID=2874281 RepID=UPI001CC039BA|nr:hypothetical protein [Marinobacter sp. F4216]MBZ2168042.1 hypothetical protein [Marinobacter sp. F4216]
MTGSVIVVTEIALVALLLLMTFRMLALVRSAPVAESALTNEIFHNAPYSLPLSKQPLMAADRADLTSKLHVLAALQNRDSRIKALSIKDAPAMVRGFAASWLYGAAISLCEPRVRYSDELIDLVAHIGELKFGIEEQETYKAVATLTESGTALACYRGGLEGAKFWQRHHYVSPEFSLYGVLTNNAFI